MDSSVEAILEGLDDAQRSAATTLQGPVRIVAGAGAGKTRTVTSRIAYGCATGEWEAGSALAVTFSVKAAAEMRTRLTRFGIGDSVAAATFHAAALQQLRRVWPDVSEAPLPRVARDPREIARRALARTGGSEEFDELQMRDVLAEINWAKVSLIAPSDYPRVCAVSHRLPPAGLEPERFIDVYTAYEQEKTSRGEIDFDDILLITCHLLEDFSDAAATIRSSIHWLTVDEYQDVSPLQHRLVELWLGGNRNVCVVGDPAQTIYSFAGASSYYLLQFADEFAPLAADVSLRNDYRSSAHVVSYANRVLAASANRQDYLKLAAVNDVGQRVMKTVYASDDEEAEGVAARIRRLTAQGAHPGDCAVLTRINTQQRAVVRALRNAGLRYRIRRDADWRNSALDDSGAQSRDAMLEAMGLTADARGVTVSTIHAAKGLEFRHVFLVGCSEGLLPYGSPGPGESLEEERRLMYVGVTRAEESLRISYAKRKDAMGGGMTRTPSRFLL